MNRLAVIACLITSAMVLLPPFPASGAKRHHRHARRHHRRRSHPVVPRSLSRSGIDEGEYYLSATHPTLSPGLVELDPVNLGMDEHNMTVRDARGRVLGAVTVMPGQTATLQVSLTAGSYVLYCSLANHERLGMRSTLTVR